MGLTRGSDPRDDSTKNMKAVLLYPAVICDLDVMDMDICGHEYVHLAAF